MVVIRLDDVLFSGDHVLAGISPHQAPESLTLNTGLGHYLDSLEKARRWAKGARLTLGGHNEAIADLPKRIDEIKSGHEERLRKVLGLLGEPRTVADVSKELFGKTEGYNVLLALEEAGAHVEYLYQRGLLEIENLEEVSRNSRSVPIRYRRLETVEPEILLAA
jgi:glyoxylase-like metal-dependent hydrolase (beta-lactamase superfamily II)